MSEVSTNGHAPPRSAPHPNHPTHPTYPVNVVLAGQRCLVVGGGRIAARKAAGLLEAGARVVVVAPEAVAPLRDDDRVQWYARPYQRGEVAAYRLAIAATGRPEVDGQVYRDAEAAGVLVNSADDPEHCRFTLPAIARRGDIQLTASTNGRSPALATWLRRRLEDVLDDHLLALLDLLSDVRAELHRDGRTSDIVGWQEALDNGLLDLVRSGDTDGARRQLEDHLGLRGSADGRSRGPSGPAEGQERSEISADGRSRGPSGPAEGQERSEISADGRSRGPSGPAEGRERSEISGNETRPSAGALTTGARA